MRGGSVMVRGFLTVVFGLVFAVLVAATAFAISGLPVLESAAGFEPPLSRLAHANAKSRAEEAAAMRQTEAKRKADEEAAKNSAPEKPDSAENARVPDLTPSWTSGNGMDATTIARANCVGEFGELFAGEAVRFTMKSAALESQHAPFLDRLGNLAKRCDGIGLLIDGNADAWGAPEFNQALSEQRAEAVRAALVERGVSSKQLATRGFGELKPLRQERSREADAANRRVDFGVIEIEKIPQTIQPKDTGSSEN